LREDLLDDQVINASMALIARETALPFQDTLCGTSGYERVPMGEERAQVLHNAALHWVAVSQLGGTIHYYDSLNGKPSRTVVRNVKQLFGTDKLSLVKVEHTQVGYKDCGMFALGYFELASSGRSRDISSVHFDQEDMRNRLIASLESGKWQGFKEISQ